MGISLFERMGGTYHREGDYFLPDLSLFPLLDRWLLLLGQGSALSFFRGALFVISVWAEPIIERVITFSPTCLYPNSPPSVYGDSGGGGI